MPGKDEVKRRLQTALRERLGQEVDIDSLPDLVFMGHVDDFYASFEWSSGGMLHAHMAFWIVGSPRIDKVIVPKEQGDQVVEITATCDTDVVLPQTEAANLMACFWDRVIAEFNVAKALDQFSQALPGEPSLESIVEMASATGLRQKFGKKQEKGQPSPECISYKTLAHCVLGTLDVSDAESEQCWAEFDHILEQCGRAKDACTARLRLASCDENEKGHAHAQARKVFVSALAEWVNMHDLHRPYAMGAPGKDQACAAIENEHSSKEIVSCNKLFPRKCIDAGCEEIAEDPRRRELYRLWLCRNCNFINNYVPIVSLAMLSNMDFQATLTKDAVIEYMTKYMTKSGQQSLFKVMENSFSVCIEKAREKAQGSGSAVLRWFNLQSISEVKSQLETMHLIFRVPRSVSSREFKDIWLRSEVRLVKTREQIQDSASTQQPLVAKSAAEKYCSRHEWQLPSRGTLEARHPLSRLPLWQEILQAVGSPGLAGDALDNHFSNVQKRWGEYLELLSIWQVRRYFNRVKDSVACKTRADIVVVHPAPRFTTAKDDSQWLDSCKWMLLAYCNHGDCCATTFKNSADLDSFADEDVRNLAERFVMTPAAERVQCRLTACPPHVRKNWLLGVARREREEARKLSTKSVIQALPAIKFVFEEDDQLDWCMKSFSDMTQDEKDVAKSKWKEADANEEAIELAAIGQDDDVAVTPLQDSEVSRLSTEDAAIRGRMRKCMTLDLKWGHSELHDALVAAGLNMPTRPSLINYFTILHIQFSNDQVGFLPQSQQSHCKDRVRAVLSILRRTGTKLGGRLSDKKAVLIQRLAHWLSKVVEVGRQREKQIAKDGSSCQSTSSDEEEGVDTHTAAKSITLIPRVDAIGEVPFDAVVNPEQAESALGFAQATEFDDELLDMIDLDLRAEEEALLQRQMHPSKVDYSCLCWCPMSDTDVTPTVVGWHPPLSLRQYSRQDFPCVAASMEQVLRVGVEGLYSNFEHAVASTQFADALQEQVSTLDPTQHQAYIFVTQWAKDRMLWRQSLAASPPPRLRLLLLGTAGTGKTHTAKTFIGKARQTFGSFGSVLTLAFSGVAAANLGDGASTIDSIFHTNSADAQADLRGDSLERLVNRLRGVQLLVIDEISTVGAAQFAIISRRLDQVGKAVWRERFHTVPPDDDDGFGGIGVVCMGDFAQLPPVLSTLLLMGVPILDAKNSGLRTIALTGRQRFKEFKDVIRLRRIHRIQGADPYKETTMRLRDAAITLDDYNLWKEHEIQALDVPSAIGWTDGEALLRDCLC